MKSKAYMIYNIASNSIGKKNIRNQNTMSQYNCKYCNTFCNIKITNPII